MTIPQTYSFLRYLSAKKSVDDRALNLRVWQALAAAWPNRSPAPVHILEVGAGIGTMVERMASTGLLRQAEYTAIDAQEANIAEAQHRLAECGVQCGYRVSRAPAGCLVLERPGDFLQLHFEAIDLFDFIARQRGQRRWDLLIAHAFLDLLDVPSTLPALFSLLDPYGLFYFTINFDGLTILEPAIDPPFDEVILKHYHRTMDERIVHGKPSGDSQSGRHLFSHLREAGARILETGASDWIVASEDYDHSYPADEAYFLHFIIHTIHQALLDCPGIDQGRFAQWITLRHAQIERGELVYIAHQLDFLGQWMGPAAE
jgi:SAM-dependent methyltransferase